MQGLRGLGQGQMLGFGTVSRMQPQVMLLVGPIPSHSRRELIDIFHRWLTYVLSVLLSTRAPPDGKAYRGSSLPSLDLQAKGSERSFTTGRRVPERKSLRKRRNVRPQYSSSGPC